ncbi:uncharacterized protein SPSK_09577 [Sporothrix schenckii 1099-18]|uniref:J domain-containing protein n=1 Tax=Sporothrix schenckii 1099-18 TaxID=1397361 RepID=A0A0F2M927_SPOSC|nr:uncharacterized protein SPSK_09577 [Sporothrix schenckii 1099-18]KJR85325.1 hypothetical protein SPSK_09577 [Sporothrix schenckii 1099-18]
MVADTELYERLGVTYDASADQIRRSYRRAAMLWHPDRNPDDPEAAEKFKACLEAYEILSNPNQRTLYDTYGLSGVLRTAADPEMSPEAQYAQPPPQPASSSGRQYRERSRPQQRPPQPSPFDEFFSSRRHSSFHDMFNDDFFNDPFFSSTRPPPMHSDFPPSQRSSRQAQSQSQSQQTPRFSFSSSFTFSTSSSNGGSGGGSYTTHTQSWNSRDGHQSRRTSGTIRPDGVHIRHDDGIDSNRRVDNSRRSSHRSTSGDGYTDNDNEVPQARQSQSMQQGMESPFNMGGGLFNLFANMSNMMSSSFGNNMFGDRDPHARQQQGRQRWQ